MLPILWLAAAPSVATEVDLVHHVAAAHAAVDQAEARDCAEVFASWAHHLDRLPRPARGLSRDASLAHDLFALRQAVSVRLSVLHDARTLSDACVVAARDLDMAQRRLTDDVLESVRPQHRPDAWLTAGEGFDPSQLRSGDVLVSRGDQLSSAGIASIGAYDAHFSHNALVYVDDAGQAWTVEAYLEKGALVQPLEDFLAHGVRRVAVMRYHDADAAERAAASAFERVAHGPTIPYDESLDADDPTRLFCSQVAGWAFARSGGPVDIPLQRTPLDHDRRGPMFAGMGVTVPAFTAPADILFDPRFELVAEWRDVEALETLRRQEAVVQGVLGWMDHEGYGLTPRFRQKATVDVGLALRRTPGLGQLVADRLHPEGERGFLVTSLTLQQAGTVLFEQLEAERGDRRSTRDELDALVVELRAADRELWAANPRKATMHRLFAPADVGGVPVWLAEAGTTRVGLGGGGRPGPLDP